MAEVKSRTPRGAVERARSLLFVPGNRPDRFPKARDSGADITILDLEDAVPADEKQDARASALEWAIAHEGCVVRINALGTPWSADEVRALHGSGVPVMVPKLETVEELRHVAAHLPGSPVIGLVETPRGVLAAQALAESGLLTRLAFGNVDFAAVLGVDPHSQAGLAPARGSLVLASAAADLSAPIDGVSTRLDDLDALERDLAHGRELGFTAKLCIHPRQVGRVNETMGPSAEEVAWAESILAHAKGGVSVVDGAMVDAPVVARAQRLMERVERS